MAAEKEDLGLVRLKEVRMSFEHVFKKVASAKDGPLKYRGNFLMDPKTKSGKTNIALCEQVIEDLKVATWGAKADRVKIKDDRMAFKDGNDQVSQTTGEIYDGYEDMMVVSAANDRKPKLRARDGQTEVSEDDDLIYSGAWVNAWIRFYAIKDPDKGGNGIFASLEAVQFVKHGEKFAGGGIDDDEFEDLGDDDDDDDDPSSRTSAKKPATKRRTIDDDDEDDAPPKKKKRVLDDDDI